MQNLNKDLLILFALELSDKDLGKFCQTEKRNNAICKNNNLWRYKFVKKYPILKEMNSNKFEILYKLMLNTHIIDSTINNAEPIGSELLDFITNIDLGNVPRMQVRSMQIPIKEVLAPLLSLKILSEPIISLIFRIYFLRNNLKNGNYYRIDENMEKYLNKFIENRKKITMKEVNNLIPEMFDLELKSKLLKEELSKEEWNQIVDLLYKTREILIYSLKNI